MDNQAIIEQNHGPIRTLILNRPETRNAFDFTLAQSLGQALAKVAGDTGCRVLILRGSSTAFSAGGDLKYFQAQTSQESSEFREVFALLNVAISQLRSMPQPVIAAVQGPAYAAGFGLTLACDLIVASARSSFSPSFINVALAPNASSTYFLPRILGPKRATEAFMRAQVYTASEALDLGIVNHVWSDEAFDEELKNLAEDLARRPRAVLTRIKQLVQASGENPWSNQIELEKQLISQSSSEADFREGISAFVAKRRPRFA